MTKQTQTQRFSPDDFTTWALWIVIFPGIFLAIGLSVIIFLGQVSQLSCSRPSESCQYQISGLARTEVKRIPIKDLQGAKIDTLRGKKSESYRVILLTRSGEVPLTQYYSSGYEQRQNIVSQIEAFLGDPQEASLTVQEDGRLVAYSVGGIFAAVGLGVLLCVLGVPGRLQLGRLLRHRAS